jgi:hypothetical protein
MRSRDGIVATIRSLLRRGGGTTPESRLARERAQELMERYGVHVTADDHERVVEGARHVYWRERLLAAAAAANECRAIRGPDVAVVVGPGPDFVAQAIALYERLIVEALVACRERARRYPWDVYPQFMTAWQRVFMNAAAEALVRRSLAGRRRRPPVIVRPTGSVEVQQQMSAETKQLEANHLGEDIAALAQLSGWAKAIQIAHDADRDGNDFAESANLERPPRLLMALSTIPPPAPPPPPPPPTRWNQLEID